MTNKNNDPTLHASLQPAHEGSRVPQRVLEPRKRWTGICLEEGGRQMVNAEFFGALLGTVLVAALVVFGIWYVSHLNSVHAANLCGYLDNIRYCIEDGKVLRMEK